MLTRAKENIVAYMSFCFLLSRLQKAKARERGKGLSLRDTKRDFYLQKKMASIPHLSPSFATTLVGVGSILLMNNWFKNENESFLIRLLLANEDEVKQNGYRTTTTKVLALSSSSSSIDLHASSSSVQSMKNALLTLSYVTGKVSAMVFINRLNFITMQVQEMEKDQGELMAEDIELMDILSPTRSKHELNVWKGFLPKVKVGVFFECNVLGVFHCLEFLARKFLSPKTAKQLTKQVSASAARKYARATVANWTTTELASKVFRTTFKAQTLYWSALFIVSVTFDAINTSFNNNGRTSSSSSNLALFAPRVKIEGSFLRRTWVNFVDCSKKCLLTAVGASLGTLVRPGLGTVMGMMILPSLAGPPK
jgi:hypothetical protein